MDTNIAKGLRAFRHEHGFTHQYQAFMNELDADVRRFVNQQVDAAFEAGVQYADTLEPTLEELRKRAGWTIAEVDQILRWPIPIAEAEAGTHIFAETWDSRLAALYHTTPACIAKAKELAWNGGDK